MGNSLPWGFRGKIRSKLIPVTIETTFRNALEDLGFLQSSKLSRPEYVFLAPRSVFLKSHFTAAFMRDSLPRRLRGKIRSGLAPVTLGTTFPNALHLGDFIFCRVRISLSPSLSLSLSFDRVFLEEPLNVSFNRISIRIYGKCPPAVVSRKIRYTFEKERAKPPAANLPPITYWWR